MLIDYPSILDAANRIGRWLSPTPLIRSGHLSDRLGANIFLKLETLQPTHSFKVRGAFNALSRLSSQGKTRGVITASGGNHGLAVAYAAKALGIPATVFLPNNSSETRIRAIESMHADVVLYGKAWDDANLRALATATERKQEYIHPFDNLDVMSGQGTIVSELVTQLPVVDTIVASIGGGGLLSGILSAAKAVSPRTRVFGVETEGADSMYQSWKAGAIVELPAITSIAETLGARKTEPRQFEIITEYASGLVTVSDAQAIRALIEILAHEKLLTEPATSCSVAALLDRKIKVGKRDTVVIVLCGANVESDRVQKWLGELDPSQTEGGTTTEIQCDTVVSPRLPGSPG